MKLRELATSITFGAALAAACISPLPAQTKAPATDNTKINQRDRAKKEPTADQAGNGAADRALMQNIRKSLLDDKDLSTYAHNVKVVAQNGKVTLKGPVRTAEEKQAVEKIASEAAGSENVTSQLTVKPAKSKTK